MHGGYLLPTVAAGLVGADVAAEPTFRSSVLAVLVTGLVAAIAIRSILDVVPRARRQADEAVLTAADNSI